MRKQDSKSSPEELAAFEESLRPMTGCPRWHRCSAPVCPLDRGKDRHVPAIDDRANGGKWEPRCNLPKLGRMALGASLPWRGLRPLELAALSC